MGVRTPSLNIHIWFKRPTFRTQGILIPRLVNNTSPLAMSLLIAQPLALSHNPITNQQCVPSGTVAQCAPTYNLIKKWLIACGFLSNLLTVPCSVKVLYSVRVYLQSVLSRPNRRLVKWQCNVLTARQVRIQCNQHTSRTGNLGDTNCKTCRSQLHPS